jgi:acyl-CoA hydrolase
LSYNELYKQKLIAAEEAVMKVNSDDEIYVAVAAAEPAGLLGKLHTVRDRVENVSVVMILPLGAYDFYMKPEMKGHFLLNAWYYGPGCRQMHDAGTVSYNPSHVHNAISRRAPLKKSKIFFGTAAPMDKHGYLNLSLGMMVEKDALEAADLVILEINENLPRTFGDTQVHIRDVDFVVENNRKLPVLPAAEITDKDKVIGQYIAELVEDGSTIQLGIGGIPNAAALCLMNKKDLGVHTEMICDSFVDLMEAGGITGRKKTIFKDKMVGAFALGSQRLYDWLDCNPGVEFQRGSMVNDPVVVARNHKMVSINTTLQVDLFGQCVSEAIGHRQYSGCGGAIDTCIGAQRGGGKSIVALYSTAKNDTISSLVAALAPGTPVTISRMDVDYVVTEYGVAALRSANIRERVRRLIAVAHPNFRDQLREQADKMALW